MYRSTEIRQQSENVQTNVIDKDKCEGVLKYLRASTDGPFCNVVTIIETVAKFKKKYECLA